MFVIFWIFDYAILLPLSLVFDLSHIFPEHWRLLALPGRVESLTGGVVIINKRWGNRSGLRAKLKPMPNWFSSHLGHESTTWTNYVYVFAAKRGLWTLIL